MRGDSRHGRLHEPRAGAWLATDKRTDIWAFGCVLYEMLTGRAVFSGATVSDTIAAILDREPDWAALPAATPEGLGTLLRRCLEKDRKRRLRDIGDAHNLLDAADAATAPTHARTGRPAIAGRSDCLAAALLIGSSRRRSRPWNRRNETTAGPRASGQRFMRVTSDAALSMEPAIVARRNHDRLCLGSRG